LVSPVDQKLAGPHGPVAIYRYRLSRADALAYFELSRELTGWEKFQYVIAIFAAGMLIGVLPTDWTPLAWWSAAAGIVFLTIVLALGWMNFRIRRQAAALSLPVGDVTLEEWGDHLSERAASGDRFIAYEMIGQVIETPGRVFVRVDDTPLIVPAAAFADLADMTAFARRIDELSSRSQA
jgi:hypothetical protein